MSPWEFLAWLLLALALAVLLRGLYEPRQLDVTRQTLQAVRTGRRARCVRVALLSDLHAEKLWIRPGQIVSALRQTPVDLVLFTGDVAGKDRLADTAEPFLHELGAVLQSSGTPFLAVTGNHDGPRAAGQLRTAGADVLADDLRRLTLADGTAIAIIGLTDRQPGDTARALLMEAGSGSTGNAGSGKTELADVGRNDAIRIVLSHNPDAVLDLPEGGADFLLSGHLHGGQIWAPFRLEFRLLRHDRLPRLGIWRGAFRLRGYQGYISRGLGCVWLPLRIFSKPELAILELVVPDS